MISTTSRTASDIPFGSSTTPPGARRLIEHLRITTNDGERPAATQGERGLNTNYQLATPVC
jgi:hypothetical protein